MREQRRDSRIASAVACAGSVPSAAGPVPQCGYAMPGPASVRCFEAMLLPCLLSTEASLVN